jgi:hypothetical protein
VSPAVVSALNLVARRFASELNTPTLVGWLFAGLGASVLAILVFLLLHHGRNTVRTKISRFLTTSSVLALPFWYGVAELLTSAHHGTPAAGHAAHAAPPPSRCGDIDVVLFDELSYDDVFSPAARLKPGPTYDPTDDTLTRASVAPLAASGRVYQRAMSPGTSTLGSVSSYLTGLPGNRIVVADGTPFFLRDDGSRAPLAEALRTRGLFHDAKQLGYRTEVFGWYFPYCTALGDAADLCRTASMYNAGTLYDGISPIAPFVTIANMWPYQWPTGLFKRPAAVWFHGAELELLDRLAATAPGDGPVLRWVHFNVPHRPWLTGNGLVDAGAFEPDLRRNAAQLDEVDRALAIFLNALRSAGRYDDATIVLTADHGARFGEKRDDPHHVPLVVRMPHGSARENVVDQVEVRDVLGDVMRRACSGR